MIYFNFSLYFIGNITASFQRILNVTIIRPTLLSLKWCIQFICSSYQLHKNTSNLLLYLCSFLSIEKLLIYKTKIRFARSRTRPPNRIWCPSCSLPKFIFIFLRLIEVRFAFLATQHNNIIMLNILYIKKFFLFIIISTQRRLQEYV